jgi:hypothetical protein
MRLEIVSKIERIGGQVFLEGDRIKVRIPETYPEVKALVEELRARKQEVLKELRERGNQALAPCGSPDCAGCYELMPGQRVHPPKAGVTPEVPPLPRRQTEIPCWHCHASGKCGCITCAEGLSAGNSAPCVVCHGSRKAKVWVQ